MRKKGEEKPENHERWLLTYADLITLLMIFFVVLYALSTVDVAKFRSLSNSLRFAFGGGRNLLGDYEGSGMVPLPVSQPMDLQVAKDETDSYSREFGLQNEINTVVDDRGLVITLQEDLLFQPGQVAITPAARVQLLALAKILNTLPNYVRVEGNTDNTDTTAAKTRSNWQLSADRAANIAQFLAEQGAVAPGRLSAIGYGENRPIADNRTLAGRAKNRRVDVVLLSRRYEATERTAR